MTPATPLPGPDRERLRQQWLAAAADAFDRMFAEQDQLVTFLQREPRAYLVGDELAAWLLGRHVGSDPHACPGDDRPPPCPVLTPVPSVPSACRQPPDRRSYGTAPPGCGPG